MAISKKPVARDEEAIERLISGGLDRPAPAARLAATSDKVPPRQSLRFPPDGTLYGRFEAAIASIPFPPTHNSWILQAIAEKLDRDGH
jgi:hypothetical protein